MAQCHYENADEIRKRFPQLLSHLCMGNRSLTQAVQVIQDYRLHHPEWQGCGPRRIRQAYANRKLLRALPLSPATLRRHK